MADIHQNEDISYEEQDVSEETISINLKTKTCTPLKDDDFVEAAGLQRTESSGKKSSVEKLLELSLNTAEVPKSQSPHEYSLLSPRSPTSTSYHLSSGSDDDTPTRRCGGRKVTPEKPQNLKSEQFIKEAGLSRTGRVPRQSSMERLLEDQLQTGEEIEISSNNDDDIFFSKHKQNTPIEDLSTRRMSTSSTENTQDYGANNNKQSISPRKNSIYEQKQIEPPTAVKGNRITARTENLFKQYERDMNANAVKPIRNVNESESVSARKASYTDSVCNEEKSKVDMVREEKEKELEEVRVKYQERLLQEEKEQAEERAVRNENAELKAVQKLGDIKSRYLAIAKGDSKLDDSDEDSEKAGDDTIVKSGGKVHVVASSDGVSNIRERFGSIGKAGWKKRNTEVEDTQSVDSDKVSSARNKFRNFESNQNSEQMSYVRPTSRKVRDPKELMEMRKKITYGEGNEELPQDGVVKKSVVLDETELGYTTSPKKNAMDAFKSLENSSQTDGKPLEKPKNRLLSDNEAIANMEVKKIENTEEEMGHNGDVSGYDTGTPCSPTSTSSDGYSSLSDTKDIENAEDVTSNDFQGVNIKLSLEVDDDTSLNAQDMNGNEESY